MSSDLNMCAVVCMQRHIHKHIYKEQRKEGKKEGLEKLWKVQAQSVPSLSSTLLPSILTWAATV